MTWKGKDHACPHIEQASPTWRSAWGSAAAIASITVRITPDGDHVQIIISDNGPGIPEADRARVFERFVRATDHGEGCGLGLSIVRDIVAQHGGTVDLGDAQPHGLQVVIRLPRL